MWNSKHRRWYHNKYHYTLSDNDSHSIINVPYQISSAYLSKCFHQFSLEHWKEMKYFCYDMSNDFVSAARKNSPDASICIDSFHVAKHLNETFKVAPNLLEVYNAL